MTFGYIIGIQKLENQIIQGPTELLDLYQHHIEIVAPYKMLHESLVVHVHDKRKFYTVLK